jgi:hypothetical protein
MVSLTSTKQRKSNIHLSLTFPIIEEKETFPNTIYKVSITLIPKPKMLQEKQVTDHKSLQINTGAKICNEI